MSTLTFKFTIQAYQTSAVESVVAVFEGQPYKANAQYRIDPGQHWGDLTSDLTAFDTAQTEELAAEMYTGYANARIELTREKVKSNVQQIQNRNNIMSTSKSLTRVGREFCNLDVEMETGTGKTYVYIKTIFELNKLYGWSKFIIVVPSIAIREGVRKSFEVMESHFMEAYGKKARYFVYESKNLAAIKTFCNSGDIRVMIINTQASNAKGKDARRITMEQDEFESRAPIEAIAQTNPIVIMDEPQKMEGKATQESLKSFNPLFILNYSATHKTRHDLVYVLDALDAYKQKLVKRIEVKGFDVKNLAGSDRYLFLAGVEVSPKKPPRARLEFEVKTGGGIRRKTRLVEDGFDLYHESGLEEYKELRTVVEVDPIRRIVRFSNGFELQVGQLVGDSAEQTLRRAQIRETIRSHLMKERELFKEGVKVLSLFFIDEVAKYRQYDAEGNEVVGEYGRIFEEEYSNICAENAGMLDAEERAYAQYLHNLKPSATHAGYFSIDKKSKRMVDSETKGKSDESDDTSAYDLILKDKERLLSLSEPVRFIFSHSALREGWDNPNVFQICALKPDGHSPTQKRQEVGRGLRLCVNQNGDRMDATRLPERVHEVNQLTVVASGGYGAFVNDLQQGIREALYDRPQAASIAYFTGKTILADDEKTFVTLTDEQATALYHYLVKNDYIDTKGRITRDYHESIENDDFKPLPDELAGLTVGAQKLVQSIFDEHALDGMIIDGNNVTVDKNDLNANFHKEEFQRLWNALTPKYAYRVSFDSDELIRNVVAAMDNKKEFTVSQVSYTKTTGVLEHDVDRDAFNRGDGFTITRTTTEKLNAHIESGVKYDLVGELAKGATITRRTATKILATIRPDTFALFRRNPEEFIRKTILTIKEQKATIFVKSISYDQAVGKYDSSIFTAERHGDYEKALQVKKCVQDWVFTDGYAKDGKSVERKFAEALESADEVAVYAKLPKGFAIPTPVGNYSPDWAIAFKKGKTCHIFFIAETKGSLDTMQLRPIEQAKISWQNDTFNRSRRNCRMKIKYPSIKYRHSQISWRRSEDMTPCK